MREQRGSTLLISLVLLTVITLVTVYLLEGTTLQSKMIANSLASSIAYRDCRNEQEANVRIYNADRAPLIKSMTAAKDAELTTSQTKKYSGEEGEPTAPKSDSIVIDWNFIGIDPTSRGGYNIDSESQSRPFIFENDCTATLNFASNSQVLGASVDGLQQAGVTN